MTNMQDLAKIVARGMKLTASAHSKVAANRAKRQLIELLEQENRATSVAISLAHRMSVAALHAR